MLRIAIQLSLRVILFFLLMGFLWFVGLILFTRIIPSAPEDIDKTTQGIVIFTGGKMRLKEALTLFDQDKGTYLLISGVNPQTTLADLIPEQKDRVNVTLDYNALDTKGNARETAKWVKKHSIKNFRLITSNYHIPRSVLEIRHLLPDVEIVTHPVVGKQFLEKKWWLNTNTLGLVVQEYNKFLFAFIRHPLQDMKKSVSQWFSR